MRALERAEQLREQDLNGTLRLLKPTLAGAEDKNGRLIERNGQRHI
ncbi:hypothetical protein ACSD7O_07265 [Methylorubrum extorquens]